MSSNLSGSSEKQEIGPKIWRSRKWKYGVAFPSGWTKPRSSGPQIEGPGVDVYSQGDNWASTAVFCYAYHPLRDLNELTDQIVNNYKKRGGASLLDKEDSERDDRRYRRIDFKFRRKNRFLAQDTLVFCPNMQLVISSNAPFKMYEKAKPVFAEIVDSLQFYSTPNETLPIREPNSWRSSDWGYSITFPNAWNDVKHGPFPDVAAADLSCESWWGSSTFVFAYPRVKSSDLGGIVNNIINNYSARGRSFRMADSRDYERNGSLFRTIIFEWTTPDRQENVGHYTAVLAKEIVLLVSSQARSRHFEVDRGDFEQIIGSVEIAET